MKFKNIFKSLNEATYYEPKYVNVELFINGTAKGGLAPLANTTVTIIEKPKKGTKVIEIIGSAVKPGVDNPVYALAQDGLVYKLINVSEGPFRTIRKQKSGKVLKYNSSDRTGIQESAVCHTLAWALKTKLKTPEDILSYFEETSADDMNADFISVQDRYETDLDSTNSVIMVKNEKKWAKSIAATTARIIAEFKIKPSSIFHRGRTDSLIKSHGGKLAGVSKPDKWNPSDIMVIKKGSSEVAKLLAADSLSEVNDIINRNLEKGKYKDFFGISLKQSTYPKAPLKYFNMGKSASKLKSDLISTSEKAKTGFSKSLKLTDTNDNISIEFRPTGGNKLVPISGKILGKNAFGGSITISELFKRNKIPLPKLETKQKYYLTPGKASTTAFYNDFQVFINEAMANAKRIGVKKYKGFLFSIKSKAHLDKYIAATLVGNKGNVDSVISALHAKSQALYMLSVIKKDDFEWSYYQASAQTEINPAFVKIGE